MRRSSVLLFATLTACTNGSSSGPTAASPFGSLDGNTPNGASVTSGTGAKVTIAFYLDASCAEEVGRRRYPTDQACFSWVASGSHAQENSASRFQCYRDRLCYTQHPTSLTCGGSFATPKESRVGECLKEPAGRLYSRIVDGTDECPPPPAGFRCPGVS